MTPSTQSEPTALAAWWLEVASVYQAEAGRAVEAGYACKRLTEAARIHLDELGDAVRAHELLDGALAHDEANLETLRLYARLPADVGDDERRIEIYRSLVEHGASKQERVEALEHLVDAAKDTGSKEQIIDNLSLLLDFEPTHHGALKQLWLLGLDGDDGLKAEALRRRIAATDDDDLECQLWVFLAQHYENAMERDDLALHAFGEANALKPTATEPLFGLYRLNLRVGDADAAERALAECIRYTSGPVADALRRLSTLARDDHGSSGGLYEGFDGLSPFLEAISTEAQGDLLEAMACYSRVGNESGLGILSAMGLMRCAILTGNVSVLVESTMRLVDAMPDPGLKASYCLQSGRRLEWVLGESDRAFEMYRHVRTLYEDSPNRDEIEATGFHLDYLRQLERRLGFGAFRDELEAMLALGSTGAFKADLSDRLALSVASQAGVGEAAAPYFDRVLRHEDGNQLAHRMIQLDHRRRRNWLPLLHSLESELPHVGSSRRLALFDEIAQTQLRLGSPKGAEIAWRKALELNPTWYPAQVGLGQLLDAQGRWGDLAEVLQLQLTEMAPDDAGRVGLLGRLAELYEFNLEKHEAAADVYAEILSLKGYAPDAVAGLQRVLYNTGAYERLADELANLAQVVDDEEERARLYLKSGDILEHKLGQPDRAEERYLSSLSCRPGWPPAVLALEWHYASAGAHAKLAGHYRALLESGSVFGVVDQHKVAMLAENLSAVDQWRGLAEAGENNVFAAWSAMRLRAELGDDRGLTASITSLAGRATSQFDIAVLLREAAERGAGHLDPARQKALWSRIADLDRSASRPWQALQSYVIDEPNADERLGFLDGFERAATDSSSLSTLKWLRGLIMAKLDAGRSLDSYRDAHDQCPDDVLPLWFLLESQEFESAEEHAALCGRLADLSSSKVYAAQLLAKAAQIRAEKLADAGGSLRDATRAVRLDPLNRLAADRAEQALISLGRFDDVIAMHEERISSISDDSVRADGLFRLALLHEKLRGDVSASKECLAAGLDLAPHNEHGQLRFGVLLASEGNYEVAKSRFSKLVDDSDDEALLADAYAGLAQCRRALGDDLRLVIDDYQRAAALSDRADIHRLLGEIYLVAGEPELAQMTFKNMEQVAASPSERLLSQLGQVEALLNAGRPTEAERRLARIDADSQPDQAGVEAAARMLTQRQKMPAGLRERLTAIVNTEPIVIAPPVATGFETVMDGEFDAVSEGLHDGSENQGPDALEVQGGDAPEERLLSLAPSHAPLDRVGEDPQPALVGKDAKASEVRDPDSSRLHDPSGIGGPPSLWASVLHTDILDGFDGDGEVSDDDSVINDPAYWQEKQSGCAADSVEAEWYGGLAAWLKGELQDDSAFLFRGSLPPDYVDGLLPIGLPLGVVQLLELTLGLEPMPLHAAAQRAEVAAEGWAIEGDSPFVLIAQDLGQSLGLDTVVCVQNDARPYTVDVLRKREPVITCGTDLLSSVGPHRTSFLVASSVLPIAKGLPLLAHTPEGRDFDSNALEEFFASLYDAVDMPLSPRLDDQPLDYTTLIRHARQGMVDETWTQIARLAADNREFIVGASWPRLRRALELYSARLALVYCENFGAAVDMLRQLDFDDRPRAALTDADRRAIIQDNYLLRDLWGFAHSDACLTARQVLGQRAP